MIPQSYKKARTTEKTLSKEMNLGIDPQLAYYLSRVERRDPNKLGKLCGYDAKTNIGWMLVDNQIMFFKERDSLIEKDIVHIKDYYIEQDDYIQLLFFKYDQSCFCIITTEKEIYLKKLFERSPAYKLNQFKLKKNSSIILTSNLKKMDDRLLYLIVSDIGDTYMVCIHLPTNSDMRFHCEYKLVKSAPNKRSLFKSIIRLSQSFIGNNLSQNSKGKVGEDFRNTQTLSKIEITSAKLLRNDTVVFSYWTFFQGEVEFNEYKVEDFWRNETAASIKIEKIRDYKLDFLNYICEHTSSHFCKVLNNKSFSIQSFDILDVTLYEQSNKSINTLVLHKITYTVEDNYRVNGAINISMISFKNPQFKNPTTEQHFIMQLDTKIPKKLVGLKGKIYDLKSEFVFQLVYQIQDPSSDYSEYIYDNKIFKTSRSINDLDCYNLRGYIQGCGQRFLENGEKLFVIFLNDKILDFKVKTEDNINPASENDHLNNLLEEQTPIKTVDEDYKLSPEKQYQIIDTAFENFEFDPTDKGLIKKMIIKLNQEIIEEKVNMVTFKLLDRNSSNMHTAVKNNKKFRAEVLEDYGDSRGNTEDMITFELEKKLKRLSCWVEFLIQSELLNVIGRDCRCFILQALEKISSILKIREAQREFKSIAGISDVSENLFDKYFSIFLSKFDQDLRLSNQESGQMEEEITTYSHENPNKFFFYISKHYKLFQKMIQNFLTTDLETEENEKKNLEFITRLLTKILAKVQQVRETYRAKLNLKYLQDNWWLHERETTYGKYGLVSFFNNLSRKFFYYNEGENSDSNLEFLINKFSKYLLIELNQDFLNKTNSVILEGDKSYEVEFNNIVNSAMRVLLINKKHDEVLKIAEKIVSFEYVCELFVNREYNVPIKKFIDEWGDDFLSYYIRFSCKVLEKLSEKKASEDEERFYNLDKNERLFYFLNGLEEYNSEVLRILREEYPGLSWILVFKNNGSSAALKEIKSLRNNDLSRSEISEDGIAMIGLVGDILDIVN